MNGAIAEEESVMVKVARRYYKRYSYVPRPDFNLQQSPYCNLVTTIEAELRSGLRENDHHTTLRHYNSETYRSIANQSIEFRISFLDWLIGDILTRMHSEEINRSKSVLFVPPERRMIYGSDAAMQILKGMLRSSQDLPRKLIFEWLNEIRASALHGGIYMGNWPINGLIDQFTRTNKTNPLADAEVQALIELSTWPELTTEAFGHKTEMEKIITKVQAFLHATTNKDSRTQPYKKLDGDNFGRALRLELSKLPEDKAEIWHKIFHNAASAGGTTPTKKFIAKTSILSTSLTAEKLKQHLHKLLGIAAKAKDTKAHRHCTCCSPPNEYTETVYLTKHNNALVKGLVFMCAGYRDAATVRLIGNLAERSLTKIPGIGAAAQATGNVCIWYLQNAPGLEAASRLSRLGLVVKQAVLQDRVRSIVAEKAAKAGVTSIQLEEMNIPDFGLKDGERRIAFEEFTLLIGARGFGDVTMSWLKSDGSEQKTKPSIVSANSPLKKRFDKAKSDVAEIKKTLTTQRDRIDRLFAEEIDWGVDAHEKLYFNHELVRVIAEKLIWCIEVGGQQVDAIRTGKNWHNVSGQLVVPDDNSKVHLWHPVDSNVKTGMAWRKRLNETGTRQPTKQAYREVYLLTDAERLTNTYSNRMAAHTVKQHQLSSLCATRGWRYRLQGAFDDGQYNSIASKRFATSPLTAEFLINEMYTADELYNDTGIWLYVGTDQIRFVEKEGEGVPLNSVPRRIFSESMRDADLFVGVASVGNDPIWFDQGPTPAARDYWQGASFGELNGFAEVRKDVLASLLPRLKIKDVAHIEGRFLIVDGKLNTYKIHLGSSNILMMPGDRYLCIVPASVPGKAASNIVLPFEGDHRLSVVLSKAFMLAEDDKITARDIVSQLKRH